MVRRFLLAAALLACATPAGHARPPARVAGPSIQDMMALVDLGHSRGGLALSPDGAHVAVFERRVDLERNNYNYALAIVPTQGGRARSVGDGGGFLYYANDGRRTGNALEREPVWSPDSQWVVFIAEREGRGELWRANIDGMRSERLASFDGDAIDIVSLSDGRFIVELDAPRALLAQDLTDDSARGYRVNDRLSPIYSLDRMPRSDRRFVLVDSAGAITPLDVARRNSLVAAAQAALPVIAPRADAPRVQSPPRELRIEIDGDVLRCVEDFCGGDVREPMLMANGEVAYTRVEGFARADMGLYVWSPTASRVRRIALNQDRLSCVAGVQIYCLREATWRPRELIAIDPATGATRVLHDPNPAWARFDQPRVERIDFTDPVRGLQSYAHLVYPQDYRAGRRYPLVIVQYRSRGFLRGGTGGEYPIYPYAAHGYFVLSVERPDDLVRQTEVDADTFAREQNLNGEEFRMKLDAIEYFLTEVERRGLVDPDRIGITGLSDGAETLYLALQRRRYAAAVTSSPPQDHSAWWLNSENFRTYLRRLGTAPPWTEDEPWRDWWQALSAYEHADEIDTPLLFNLTHSEALAGLPLYVRLREQGAATDMYLYPGAYHLKWRPLQLLAAQERSMAWFDLWLRDAEVDDPLDPERITRWRSLRAARSAAQARP